MALFQDQLDTITDQLERMQPRERLLLVVGGLAGLLLFGFLMHYFISSKIDSLEAANRDMEIKLERIIQKQAEYLAARRKVKQLKDHIAQNNVERLIPYLDSASKNASLNIQSMNPINLEIGDGKKRPVKELSVRVELTKASLAAVARFFETIERSGKVVKVRELRMRPNFSDPKKVNVIAIVSTFRLNK